MLDFGVMHVV